MRAMITQIVFGVFVAACCLWIGTLALREHRAVLSQRRGLLDEAAKLFSDARVVVAADQFPVLVACLDRHREVKIELIADTMVFRRLPQLWLIVTLRRTDGLQRPVIGALARPTGAEYYSLVHDLPEWMMPPEMDTSLLMRGDGQATPTQVERVSAMFTRLFADPTVKEAVVTPSGTRLIRQAAQGERSMHLLLRQTRFLLASISPDLVSTAISEAEALGAALAESAFTTSDHVAA
jgi:hypothetical protein